MTQPTLHTKRLVLRPFALDDAPRVQLLAAAREVAATTLRIPHPYEDGMAETWIASLAQRTGGGEEGVNFAITLFETGELLGSVGLVLHPEWERATLGYWIGVPYWGHGYATEAAREIVRYGFEEMRLNRIEASVFANNPASARVLQKTGLSYEGRHVQSIKKWGEFLDTDTYAIVRARWQPTAAARS